MSWQAEGLCNDILAIDPQTFDEYFYPESYAKPQVRMAKKICAACDVRVECLGEALDNHDLHGVKGGLTPLERRQWPDMPPTA